MKTKYMLLAAVLLLAAGCLKNTDEVNYGKFNEVVLSDEKAGDEEGKIMYLDRFQTLNLTPTITQSIATGEANLEFSWKIRRNDVKLDPNEYTEWADTRNLSEEVTAAVGKHRIVYSVTDKNTGIAKYLYYNVQVLGEYTQGWTILEEVAGGGDISMILPSGSIARNIYSKENGEFLETPCRSISLPNFGNLKKVFVLTATQGIECSREEYTKVSTFVDWFVSGTEPEAREIKPQLYKYTHNNHGGLVNDSKYYARIGGGFPGDPAFGGAIPAPVEDNGFRRDYEIAPFIVGRAVSTNTGMQVIYDNLHRRFLYLALEGLTPCLKHYPYSAADAWDPTNVGLTMAYMDDSNITAVHNALMYDDAGDLYILKFDSRAADVKDVKFPVSKDPVPADLKGFTTAVSSKVLDHMYVAMGNKIYHYDLPGSSASIAYMYDPAEKVVRMHTINDGGAETLYVATYDGTQGRVYYFPLEPTGKIKDETFSERFQGFGKIVDMQYKE